ncbi:hypothetical protein V8J82_04250 [Gymnodinialimonas sp. 2305UL16-5]|uniref:hypothetical protein n=1 Tax=Gymnodinialimonas mytili TaxID=3126503 RepID=UPI0030B4CD56
MTRALIPFWLAILVSALLIFRSVSAHGWIPTLTAEGLGLEMSTTLVHAAAAILLAATLSQRGQIARFWPVAALVALFSLRELDFNDWWFEPGLLEIELLFSDVPLWHKIVSVLAMIAVAFVILRVLFIGTMPLFRQRSEAWARIFPLIGLTIVASMTLDYPAKTAAQFGVTLSQAQIDAIVAVEESSEFLLALFVMLSICLYRRGERAPAARNAEISAGRA